MKIITFMNNKGGVGKTTLCAALARSIQLDNPNERILLVDADRSLKVWHNAGDGMGFDLIGATTRASLLSAKRLGNELGAQIMMIDTGGHLVEVVGAAASLSDLIIVPLRPSPLDIWASLDSINIIDAALSVNPKIGVMFVLNLADPKTLIINDSVEALKNEAPHVAIAKTVVHERIAFMKAMNNGKTIYELKGKDKDKLAIKEIDSLTSEIFRTLF